MRGLNKAQVIGHLGAEPTTHTFENGNKVTTISVATSEKWTDKNTGELREQTEWHRISFFGALADIAEKYLRKGSLVYVEGKLKTRKWTDQQNIERFTTEIQATSLEMLDSKPETNQGGQSPQQTQQAPQAQAQAQQPTNNAFSTEVNPDEIPY